MASYPLPELRLSQTVPPRIQKSRQRGLNSASPVLSSSHRPHIFGDERSDLRNGQIQRETHEERDRIAISLLRRADAVNSRPHGALRRRFERVSEIHDEGAGDGGGGEPATVLVQNFETFLRADLVKEREPAARVLVRTDALDWTVCSAWHVVFQELEAVLRG